MKKKHIYIITRLFNVNDRMTSLKVNDTINKWISTGLLGSLEYCFLPYRDSNDLVKDMEYKTEAIFKLDCAAINDSSCLVGYCDGIVYDSGIGFELGYAYSLGKQAIIMTTDYYLIQHNNILSSISPLADYVSNIIHVRESFGAFKTYEENLLELEREVFDKLKRKICEVINYKNTPFPTCNYYKYDYYIDSMFAYGEANIIILEKITNILQIYNRTYVIGRMWGDNVINEEISIFLSCKAVIIYSNDFEMDIDSAILQGMAYGTSKEIILFGKKHFSLFQSNDFVLNKNPMIEFSATQIINNTQELENTIIKKDKGALI